MTRNPSVIIFTLLCIVIAWACKKTPTEPTAGTVVLTDTATSVSTSEALLNGSVSAGGVSTTCYFEYGATRSYGSQSPVQDISVDNAPVAVSYRASGLAAGTEYHFRVTASNANGAFPGSDQKFTTLLLTPAVTLDSVMKVDQNTVVLKGRVNPMGFATTFHFAYGTSTNYGTVTPTVDAGSGVSPVGVSVTISNLVTGTFYHCALVAKNSQDSILSHDLIFAAGFPPPGLTLNAALMRGPTVAILSGYVNPNGTSASFHFEYGTTPGYGQSTAIQNAGAGMSLVPVTATLSSLTERTTYHWRLVAVNGGGTSATSDSVFSTPRDFVMPQAVGTVWQYAYSDHMNSAGIVKATWGVHTWTIKSRSTDGPATTIQMEDVENDSVRQTFGNVIIDSTHAQFTNALFGVTVTADTILFDLPETRGLNGYRLPASIRRSVSQTSDTITVPIGSGPGITWGYFTWINGVGLYEYNWAGGSGHFTEYTSLKLITVTPK